MSLIITSWFPNRISARLFIIVFFLWAISEVYNTFGTRRYRQTLGARRNDQGSYWIIFLIVWGSMIVSFLARAFNLGVFHTNLQFLGIGVVLLGIVLREWSVISLGRFFNVSVMVASGQILVKRGPYHWLRHPAYSGSILSLVGFSLSIGTWAGALLVFLLSFIGYLHRVRIEEKALLEALGDEYRAYMQHSWRFFPGL
jgi:protein-S-isoprenylcysteine O-methyltransferase Ste14